ncbi:MAG: DUF2061 domain-containing protein [Bacteroidota bacterium]
MESRRESRLRSMLKALSWRIVATTTIVIIAYCLTGDVQSALEIGFIEFFIKFALYYGHERLWQWIPQSHLAQWLRTKFART